MISFRVAPHVFGWATELRAMTSTDGTIILPATLLIPTLLALCNMIPIEISHQRREFLNVCYLFMRYLYTKK